MAARGRGVASIPARLAGYLVDERLAPHRRRSQGCISCSPARGFLSLPELDPRSAGRGLGGVPFGQCSNVSSSRSSGPEILQAGWIWRIETIIEEDSAECVIKRGR